MSVIKAVREELAGLQGVAAVTKATALRLAEILDVAEPHQASMAANQLRQTMKEARIMGVPLEKDPVDKAKEEFGG